MLDQFKILREDINDFTYITYKNNSDEDEKTYLTRKARDAFRQVIVGMKQYKTKLHLDLYELNHKLGEIRSILLAIESLLIQINNSVVPSEDKIFLKNLIVYQFNSKISHAFDGMDRFKASLQKPCEECGKVHIGVPDDLFEIATSIKSKL